MEAQDLREELRLLIYGQFKKDIKTIDNDEQADTLRVVFKDGTVRFIKVS